MSHRSTLHISPLRRSLALRVLPLLVFAACTDRLPVRLVAGRADTIVVHNRQAVQLPVFGVGRRGDTVALRNLRFRRLSGAPIRVTSSGMATCDRAADAQVEVSHRRLSSRFVLMCRPILGFRFRGNASLLLGGPAVPMQLDAVGMDGESVAPIFGTAIVEDSSVATMRGMFIAAKAPGRTRVQVEAGDCSTEIGVEVNERVHSLDSLRPFQEFATPVSIVAGEVQAWPIVKGDYLIDFQPLDSASRELAIGAAGAQCVGSSLRGYHCLALQPAKIVLRHPGDAGSGATVTGTLSVRLLANGGSNAKRSNLRTVRLTSRRRTPCKDFRFRGLATTSPDTVTRR